MPRTRAELTRPHFAKTLQTSELPFPLSRGHVPLAQRVGALPATSAHTSSSLRDTSDTCSGDCRGCRGRHHRPPPLCDQPRSRDDHRRHMRCGRDRGRAYAPSTIALDRSSECAAMASATVAADEWHTCRSAWRTRRTRGMCSGWGALSALGTPGVFDATRGVFDSPTMGAWDSGTGLQMRRSLRSPARATMSSCARIGLSCSVD